MVMSRNMPPETRMYETGGGAGSRLTMCSNRGVPISPLTTAWRTRAKLASHRRLKPICSFTPACSTAARARSMAEIVRDRFFKEDVLARLRRLHDEVRVGIGGGADQDGLDFRIREDLRAGFGNRGNSAACRHRLRSLAVDVRDGQYPGFRDSERRRFGMYYADSPGAEDSDIQLFYAQGVLFENDSIEIGFNGAQVLAVAPRALFRRAHSRQNVLLHQNVTRVAPRREAPQQGRKIHTTLAQFAEDSVAQRREVIPLLRPRPPRYFRLTVLAVDVPDPLAITLESRHHVAIPATGAIAIVASVEHQPEPLGIGQLQQSGDFIRRLHIPGAVMVEDGPQARLLINSVRQPVRAGSEYFPLRGTESRLRGHTAGLECSFRHGAVVVRQDQVRRRGSRHGGQQSRSLHRSEEPARVRGRVLQYHRDGR